MVGGDEGSEPLRLETVHEYILPLIHVSCLAFSLPFVVVLLHCSLSRCMLVGAGRGGQGMYAAVAAVFRRHLYCC